MHAFIHKYYLFYAPTMCWVPGKEQEQNTGPGLTAKKPPENQRGTLSCPKPHSEKFCGRTGSQHDSLGTPSSLLPITVSRGSQQNRYLQGLAAQRAPAAPDKMLQRTRTGTSPEGSKRGREVGNEPSGSWTVWKSTRRQEALSRRNNAPLQLP